MFKDIFRVNLSYWLLVPAILQATIPWLAFRVRIIAVFMLVIVWALINFSAVWSAICSRYSRSFRVVAVWFLIYNFLNNFYAIAGYGDFTRYGEATMHLAQFMYFVIAHFVVVTNKHRELKFLTFWVFLGIIVAGLMSMRGMNVAGLEGARALVGTQAQEITAEREDMIIQAATLGLGDYRYVYMSAWLFGMMMMTFTMAKTVKVKILAIFVAMACIISVKMGGLGTPAFILGVSVCIYLAWRMCHSRRIVKVVGYSLVIAIALYFAAPIVYRPLSAPLRYIAENMQEGSIKSRVMLAADSFLGDDNYARERARLQLISWATFCKYPILGEGMYYFEYGKTPKNRAGGHSLILDRLAMSGIVGFLPFVFFLYYLSRYYEDISRGRFWNGWLSIPTMFIALYVFSSIANPTFGIPNVIYIIMPGLAYMITISRNGTLIDNRFYNYYVPRAF